MPPSISHLAYILPKWAFTLIIATAAMLTVPPTIDIMPDGCQPIAFAMGIGLFMVAASPHYRTEATTLHNIGGWLAAIAATLSVAITQPLLLLLWLAFIPLMRSGNRTFYAECICALTVIANIIIAYSDPS